MKLNHREALRLANAVELVSPALAAQLRDAASKYTHVIVTVT